MLRILILVSSIAVISLFVYFMTLTNAQINDLDDYLLAISMSGYPLLVLFYAITTKPPSGEAKKVTYLDLFFERRRLEEQAKIDKLKSDAK